MELMGHEVILLKVKVDLDSSRATYSIIGIWIWSSHPPWNVIVALILLFRE